MDQVNNPINVYSIFDKPGEYWNITKKEYVTIIENNLKYDSPIEIIIPTYKRSTLLLEALNSAMSQDVDFNYLITIIDNDPESLDEKLLRKKEYKGRIRYLRNKENLGLYGNWNRALQVSRAPFVALLHDDDILEPNYLSSLIKVIDKYPEVGVVTHIPYQIKNGEIIDYYLSIIGKIKKNTIQSISWKEYLYGNITNASCMLISKSKAIHINGWSSEEFPSADWFFNARMAYNYGVMIYYLPLSKYRWDVNASLLPEMEKRFQHADSDFILNNLYADNDFLSKVNILRIKLALNLNFVKLDQSYGSYNLLRLRSIHFEFEKNRFVSRLLTDFFRLFNRIERFYLWFFKSRRL